jgi:choline dehydrogenase
MIYMRGQPEDFDGWAAMGCHGWGWDDVLPFFRKCEDQSRGADQFHGVGGPVSVSDLPSTHRLGEAFHAASEKLGSPRNDDFNGAAQLGTGYVQTTTRKARRWSTAQGYLRGPMARRIDVKTHALVERINLDGKHAVSVTWKGPKGRQTTAPTREIILCGGVYNSPQILMRSGIGPAAHLTAQGVAVAHDLPDVGEHLQDHFGVGLEFESRDKSTVNDIYNNPLKGGRELLRYLLFRKGPFADNGNYSNTFIHTSPDIPTPDMMVTFMAWCTGEDLKPRPFSGFTILAEHIRPDARGHVRLTGPRPTDPPAIRFNFLETEADRQAALAGLKFGRRISQTDPMATCVERELTPGLGATSDADLLTHCRDNGLSLLHGVGTCRMGPAGAAVVDSRLCVHGVAGLRVVDASVMPRIVSGNTNAAAIMIGEKGADMIIEDTRERLAAE